MLFHNSLLNLKNQSFGKPNTFLTILIVSLLISTSAAQSQDREIFEGRLNVYKQSLAGCVTQYQLQGEDISICANVFSSTCLNDRSPDRIPSVLCAAFEGLAWIELGESTSPDKIGVADGKNIIPPDVYLMESDLRSQKTAEMCGSMGNDRIAESNRCFLSRSIDQVKWHFQLYRDGW